MKKIFCYLGISMMISHFSAIIYVIVFTVCLPVTDMASGMLPFEDPLVLPVMLIIATFFGFAGWPFLAVFGRRSQLSQVVKWTSIAILFAIIGVTPFNIELGLYAALFAALLVLIFFWRRDLGAMHKQEAEQGGAHQSVTRPESKSE